MKNNFFINLILSSIATCVTVGIGMRIVPMNIQSAFMTFVPFYSVLYTVYEFLKR